MKVNRIEFLNLLKALSPALAGAKSQLPELSHIWFSGTQVSTFNDVIGIRVDFETDFTGGLLGDKLIGVLERSVASDIDIEVEGEDALFKIGSARIKFVRRPIEDWFWNPEIPQTDDRLLSVLKSEFLDSIPLLLLSVGASAVLNPEQRGITVIQQGNALDMYSTDAVSLSRVSMMTEDPLMQQDGRVILPTVFCEELKGLKNKIQIQFDENAVYCMTQIDIAGKKVENALLRDMLLFSKLVADDDPVPFADVVKQNSAESIDANIPEQLKIRAERAMVLLSDQPIELSVEDKSLYLYAQTPYGEVDDVLKFDDHPDIKVKIDLSLLHRVLDYSDAITIASNALVLKGPKNFLHIIATK